MNATVKKVLVLAGSSVAVAGGGFATYILAKRAPKRQAFRDATGWRPTVAPPRKTMATATQTSPYSRPADLRSDKPRPGEIAKSDPDRPKTKPGLIGAVKEVFTEFSGDDVMTQAAALAFYSGLAFAPLLTVAVWILRVSTGNSSKDHVADVFGKVLGPATAEPLKQLLKEGGDKGNASMTVAGIISIVLVIFSASGVFGQVQSALNAVWHVEPKPSSGIMGFVRKRLLSVGMLASIMFLLMTSLILSTGLSAFLKVFGSSFGAIILAIAEPTVSLLLFTVLFAAMFRFVPDAKIEWKPVWIGAAISAVLFTIGKYGLAIYLGHTDYNSSYGAAAGSFVALLTWVYYSSIIMLLGAEATEVTARRLGHGLQPDEHAVRVVKTTEPATK
jgi:membrane protein